MVCSITQLDLLKGFFCHPKPIKPLTLIELHLLFSAPILTFTLVLCTNKFEEEKQNDIESYLEEEEEDSDPKKTTIVLVNLIREYYLVTRKMQESKKGNLRK